MTPRVTHYESGRRGHALCRPSRKVPRAWLSSEIGAVSCSNCSRMIEVAGFQVLGFTAADARKAVASRRLARKGGL